jgi:hypothetical protein
MTYQEFSVFYGETLQGVLHALDSAHIYVLEQDVHCGLARGTHLPYEHLGQGTHCYSHQNSKDHGEDSLHQEHQDSSTGV